MPYMGSSIRPSEELRAGMLDAEEDGLKRCNAKHCDAQIKAGGYTCSVCNRSFCQWHTSPTSVEMNACCDCLRDCISCAQTFPATEGVHLRGDFFCGKCWKGRAVIEELATPVRPLVEEPNEVCA